MRILKFGGKSLETKEKFCAVCEFIKSIYQKDKQIIVVVSAIGNTTNELLSLSHEFGNNQSSNAELAKLLACGETQAAALFAMRLNSMGIPAQSFSGKDIDIFTFGDFNNARVFYVKKNNFLNCINSNCVAVVAGFQGLNKNGQITTLGRGGSDTTAVALATAFGAEAEIYSDYDGVFAGDPRTNEYKKFDFLSFDFTENLSRAGAKVLDERAVKIAKKHKTTIIAKSAAEPNLDGSIISEIGTDNIAINLVNNLCKITIVFSNPENLNKIMQNVFFVINNDKFYNLEIFEDNISFLISSQNSERILRELSAKLDLIK